MINKKKTGLCLALAATLIASSALCGCQQSDSSTSAKFNSDVKDASKYTADENAQVYKTLDFSDEQEKEFAKKGFITAPDKLEIKTENGTVAWSQTAYDFIRNSSTPDSANPSLWRNTELNSLYGLFEVVDGVYQVRGYDVANVTFVKSDNGWIVFDCTTSSETAKAALELLESKFGKAHIAAVVVSHAHIDHYGGIGGLIDEKNVTDSSLPLDEQIKSGKTLIIVPEGYEKAVMEENVFAGNAMKRRTNFQYGSLLDKGGKGSLSVGIGLTPSSGTTTYISPSYEVKKATETIKVDGVDVRHYDHETLHNIVGYIPQKAVLFSGNITSNMTMGTSNNSPIDDAKIWEALELAQGKDFVENKEGQLKAEVAQAGSNFSGGQKQRLAIARALARKPEILIFDDSFSALDYKTDRKLRQELSEKTQDMTKLIVAQRISTIMDADQILVLDKGKVVGQGTHEELLANNEVYQEIAYSQLSKEELEDGK